MLRRWRRRRRQRRRPAERWRAGEPQTREPATTACSHDTDPATHVRARVLLEMCLKCGCAAQLLQADELLLVRPPKEAIMQSFSRVLHCNDVQPPVPQSSSAHIASSMARRAHLAGVTSWTAGCRVAASMRCPFTPLIPKELLPTVEPDASAVAPGPGCRGMLGSSPRRACHSVAAACTCGFMTRRCITGGCAPYRMPCAANTVHKDDTQPNTRQSETSSMFSGRGPADSEWHIGREMRAPAEPAAGL